MRTIVILIVFLLGCLHATTDELNLYASEFADTLALTNVHCQLESTGCSSKSSKAICFGETSRGKVIAFKCLDSDCVLSEIQPVPLLLEKEQQ